MRHLERTASNINAEPVFKIESGSQKVTAGNQSTVINSSYDEIVLISAVSNCYIKIGTNPTASASDSMYLAIGTILPLKITMGYKISVFLGDITITQ